MKVNMDVCGEKPSDLSKFTYTTLQTTFVRVPFSVLVARVHPYCQGRHCCQSSALLQRGDGIFAFNNQLLPNAANIKGGFAIYCSKCLALIAGSVNGTSTRSATRSFACETPSNERHILLLSSDFVSLGREMSRSKHTVDVAGRHQTSRRTPKARVALAPIRMRDRPESASRSARRAGTLFAASPAMPDDALGTSRAADAPVMSGGFGRTEIPYASSGRWMLHIEQTGR
jgi:hypothetical protein